MLQSAAIMFVCGECGRSFPERGSCDRCGVALTSTVDDALLGKLIGSYLIARRIGAGGMGQVYRAVHPDIGSRVAIKVLSHECSQNRDLVERFFAEARAVNVIRHEGIVNVLDLSSLPDGRPYIVMEHLDGEALSALIRRRGALPFGSLAYLMLEVLDALRAAHEKGIVHRDLKPDNVFVTPAGHAKVLDFGIAKLKPELGAMSDGTRTGSLLGTPHYMSPEQAMGRQADARSDLYAVAVILYEGFTGRRPFDAPTLYELLKQQVEQYPPPPTSLRPDLPPALEHVLRRGLDKDPAQRFQSAAELAAALASAASSLTGDAFAPLGSAHGGVALRAPAAGGGQLPTPQSAPSAGAALPTPGAYSQPLPPRKRGLSPTHFVIGAAVLLVIGVIAAGSIAAALAFRSGTSTANNAVSTGAEPEENDEEVPEQVALAQNPLLMPIPGHEILPNPNPKSFDVGGFLPEAQKLAKKFFDDVQLERFDAMNVTKTGRVDFTTTGAYVIYRFRSPAHSERPADLPTNVEYHGKCTVYVTVDQVRILATVPDSSDCGSPLPGTPRCSPQQAWSKGESLGAPKGHLAGMLGFWAEEGKKGRWYLNIAPSFSSFIDDDC
jgi:serine/threonine-protein kinase